MTSHAVYPNAPLTLVTVEIRLAYQPRINQRGVRDSFAIELDDLFPILSEETVKAPTGGSGEALENIPQIRAVSVDRSASVALSANSLSVIVSGKYYSTFSELAPTLNRVYKTALDLVPNLFVQRVGVRFLDEVRLPVSSSDTIEWAKWINPDLLAAAVALRNGRGAALNAEVTFDTGDDSAAVLRYADGYGASVVSPGIPLDLPSTGNKTDFFLFDVDSWWQPAEPQSLDSASMADKLTSLHAPIEELFDWSMTEEARERFMLGGDDHDRI